MVRPTFSIGISGPKKDETLLGLQILNYEEEDQDDQLHSVTRIMIGLVFFSIAYKKYWHTTSIKEEGEQ